MELELRPGPDHVELRFRYTLGLTTVVALLSDRNQLSLYYYAGRLLVWVFLTTQIRLLA